MTSFFNWNVYDAMQSLRNEYRLQEGYSQESPDDWCAHKYAMDHFDAEGPVAYTGGRVVKTMAENMFPTIEEGVQFFGLTIPGYRGQFYIRRNMVLTAMGAFDYAHKAYEAAGVEEGGQYHWLIERAKVLRADPGKYFTHGYSGEYAERARTACTAWGLSKDQLPWRDDRGHRLTPVHVLLTSLYERWEAEAIETRRPSEESVGPAFEAILSFFGVNGVKPPVD